jgi:phage terminase large subunit GpA-like protein
LTETIALTDALVSQYSAESLGRYNAGTELREAFFEGLHPDPDLTFTEWAEKYFHLPPGSDLKGLIKFDLTPYIPPVLDALSWASHYRTIVFIAGTQVGKSIILDIVIQATIDMFPVPVLVVFGSDDMAVNHVKIRIEPGLENNPRLIGKVKDSIDKKGKSTRKLKVFDGGTVKFAGGVSGKSFRDYSAAIAMVDDLDALPRDVGGTAKKTGEGSPTKLIKNRTDARGGRYKIFFSGTTTDKETSLIWSEFERTDKNFLEIDCPECGESQPLDFFQIKFDYNKDYELTSEPEFECRACQQRINESEKLELMQKGRFKPTAKAIADDVIGFHLGSQYSNLGFTWSDMAQEWLDAVKEKKRGNILPMVHFYNTRLGLPWDDDPAEVIDHHWLLKYRCDYTVTPKEAVIITAGIDVQGNRMEITVVGNTEDEKRYLLEHKIIGGDPWIPYGNANSPWNELEKYITETRFDNEYKGNQPILASCLDIGYCSLNASPFLSAMHEKGVEIYGVIGQGGSAKNFISPENANKYGVKFRPLNVDVGKFLTHNQLKMTSTDDRMIFFNHHPTFTENFFRQMTIESIKEKIVNGVKVKYWHVPEHKSNEVTDTVNYALAAIRIYGEGVNLDWEDHRQWNENGCPDETGSQGIEIIAKGERA